MRELLTKKNRIMEKIIKKIFDARNKIANTSMKKQGYNDYSKYSYFTPEQIEQLVWDVCHDLNLFTEFTMEYDEKDRLVSKMSITDLESMEAKVYTFPAAIPELKATNSMQQIGGSMTFANRYAKMIVFGITDNSLDPDTTENTKKTVKQQQSKVEPPEPLVIDAVNEMNNCKTLAQLKACWSKYPQFQKNSEFIKSKDTLKLKLN